MEKLDLIEALMQKMFSCGICSSLFIGEMQVILISRISIDDRGKQMFIRKTTSN